MAMKKVGALSGFSWGVPTPKSVMMKNYIR